MSSRRPSGPASARPGFLRASTDRRSRSLRGALVGVVAGAALIGGTPAIAAPPPPPNPTDDAHRQPKPTADTREPAPSKPRQRR